MNSIANIQTLMNYINSYCLKNTSTNNYVLSNAYSRYIADKKLFFDTTISNAAILVEKPYFYQLYYYINNQKELMTFDIDKPITMEILYRGEDQRPKEIIRYWEECGFKQHLTRDILVGSYKQLILSSKDTTDIKIKYVQTDKEIVFSKELIENTFDRYTGDILTLDEVKSFVKNRNIICAYFRGKLSGTLQFEIKNSVVWLGHIAVAPEFRGNGIAHALVKAYITNNLIQPDTRYQLWVIQDNIEAKGLYHKIGFVYGNKSSASMLKD